MQGEVSMAVICVLSHPPRFTQLIESVDYPFPEHISLRFVHTTLKNVARKALALDKSGEVDVFLSAGVNGMTVMALPLQARFVNLDVTGFDLMAALSKAAKDSSRAAVITYKEPVKRLRYVKTIFTLNVEEFVFQDVSELDDVFKTMLEKRISVAIGSSLIVEYADLYNLTGVYIYSADGVVRAMDHAVSIIDSAIEERKKAEEFKTILDYAQSGIMAVDQTGVIKVFNPAAVKIAGVPAEKAVGSFVSDVITDSRLLQVMQKREGEYNQIQMLNGTPVLTNRVPVMVDAAAVGAVATFQDFSSIHRAGDKIKNKNREKGFVAKADFTRILGGNETIRAIREKAVAFALKDFTVLITGETGTGKELFAAAIHNASKRRHGPFVAVNCSTFHESLLESELFGYVEGAFTGALKNGRAGLFEMADGGTLFLDEIGDFPLHLQARLLRTLEERTTIRIGSDRMTPVDIRVIAATNRDLFAMTNAGQFRRDLYYRLNVLSLQLPPLRDRLEDIAFLAEQFCAQLLPDLGKRAVADLSRLLLELDYSWPGNVREVRNIMERFSSLFAKGDDACSVMREVLADYMRSLGFVSQGQDGLEQAIARSGGSKSRAAKELGISRTTLWRKTRQQADKRKSG